MIQYRSLKYVYSYQVMLSHETLQLWLSVFPVIVFISVITITVTINGHVLQRCADCGLVRLRTQIRKNFRFHGLTRIFFRQRSCGRGLTRILHFCMIYFVFSTNMPKPIMSTFAIGRTALNMMTVITNRTTWMSI